jgi:hypothetical protein
MNEMAWIIGELVGNIEKSHSLVPPTLRSAMIDLRGLLINARERLDKNLSESSVHSPLLESCERLNDLLSEPSNARDWSRVIDTTFEFLDSLDPKLGYRKPR